METELEIIDPAVPATNIDPVIDGFDIIEENTNEPTAEELKAQLEEIKAANEALKTNADLTVGMQQGFQTLASQLAAQNAPKYDNLPGLPNAQPAPVQNYSLPDKETFEKEFFTNPYDSFTKMLAPVIGNQQNAINNQMAEMNKMISKNQVYMNEANKEILSKYGDEVEVYASRLGGNNPYGDAIKQVTMNHFNDIMTEKTKSVEEQAYAKAKAEFEAASANLAATTASPVGTTALGTTTNPGAKKVKITKGEMDKVKALTATKFGPDSGPEVELQMYNYMKSNGML